MISIDYLKTFVQFAKSGNMASAAQALGLSQPAVSKQLRILEESYGRPLFIPKANRKTLSPLGQSLYEKCGPLIEEIENAIHLTSEKADRPIIIAGRESVLEKLIHVIPRLQSSVEIQFCSSSEATDKVLNHEADIAITYVIPQSAHVVAKKLFTSVPLLVFSIEHFGYLRGKNFDNLSAADLLRTPILCHRKDDPALIHLCKAKDVSTAQLNFAIVSPNWEILVKAAEHGSGIGIVPSERWTKGTLSKIEFDSDNPLHFNYHLVYSKSFSKNENGRKLISKLLA